MRVEQLTRDVHDERDRPARRSAPAPPPHAVLALQRSIGNHAVTAMLARGGGDGDAAFTGPGQTIGGEDSPAPGDTEEIQRRRDKRGPEYQRELAEARGAGGSSAPPAKRQQPSPSGAQREPMTLAKLLARDGGGSTSAGAPGPGAGHLESRSGSTVVLTETKEVPEEAVASRPPDSAAPKPLNPQQVQAKLIDLYRKDMETGGAWGGEAELAVFAAMFNATFLVHHNVPGQQPYTVPIGAGAHVFHLHHNGIHYDVLQVVGDTFKLIPVAGDGACMFAAAWLATTGERANAGMLATLRRLIARGLTDEQIIAVLGNVEAAQGAELLGVGPGVMGALHPPAPKQANWKTSQAEPLTPEQRKEQAAKASGAAETRAKQGQTVPEAPAGEAQPQRSMEERRQLAMQSALAAKRRSQPQAPDTPVVPTQQVEALHDARDAQTAALAEWARVRNLQPAPPKSLTGEHADALQAAAEAKTAAYAEWARVRSLQPAAPKSVTGAHADALKESADAKTAAYAQYGQRPKPAAPAFEPLPRDLDLLFSFGATEAEQLVKSQLPEGDVDVWQLLGDFSPDALSALGFDWENEHHTELVRAALEKVQAERAEQRAAAAQAAQAALIKRKAAYNPDNADTWQLNPVQYYTPAVSAAKVSTAEDADGIVASIQKAFVFGNGPKGARLAARVGVAFHTHLQSGTWGLAYMFVLEADYTVTPWIIDFADDRTATNMYYWKAGIGFTPPMPQVPPKKD